jgi:hypothetical protein
MEFYSKDELPQVQRCTQSNPKEIQKSEVTV